MSKRPTILGVDWSDIGRKAMGGLHIGGKVILSAFGASAAVAPLEKLEQKGGILPTWAAAAISVDKPDYVVLVRSQGAPTVATAPSKVVAYNGTRLDGNGYKTGDGIGSTFSFGVDSPARVDITAGSKSQSYTDVKQVLFLGGKESTDTILGENMDTNVIGELEEICGDLATGTDAFGNPAPYGLDANGLALTAPASGAAQVDALGNPAPYGLDANGVALPAPVASVPSTLPPPSANALRSPAYRAAQARLTAAQARLAATQAMQAPAFSYTSTPINMGTPIVVPAFNVALPGSSVMGNDGNLNAKEMEDILGAGSTIKERTVPKDPPPKKKNDPGSTITMNMAHGGRRHTLPFGVHHNHTKHQTDYVVLGEAIDEVLGFEFEDGDEPEVVVLGERDEENWTEVVGDDSIVGLSALALSKASAPTSVNPMVAQHVATALKLPMTSSIAKATIPKATSLAALAKKAPVPTKSLAIKAAKKIFKVAGKSKNKSPHKLALTRTLNAANRATRAGQQAKSRASMYKPPGALPTAVHGSVIGDEAFAYDILGEDSAFAYDILGADGGYDVLGMTDKQRKALNKYLAKMRKIVVSGDDVELGAYEVLGAEGYDVLGMSAAQRKKLNTYMAKIRKSIGTVLSGDESWTEVVGAMPTAGLTPAQRLAAQKREDAALRTQKAIANVQKKADVATKAAAKAAAAVQKAKPIVDKLLKKSTIAPTRVHGDDEVLGYYPGDPLYDPRIDGPNGTPPPSTGYGGVDPTTGYPIDPTTGYPIDPTTGQPLYSDPYSDPSMGAGVPTDYSDGGDIPLPVRGQPLSKDDASTVWNDVPADGVIYQGDKGFPDQSVGSWSTFYGKDGNGHQALSSVVNSIVPSGWQSGNWYGDFVAKNPSSPLAKAMGADITPGFMYGKRATDPNNPGSNMGWVVRDEPQDWSVIINRVANHPQDDDGEIEGWIAFHTPDASLADVRAVAQNSINRGWGPLIGNPSGPLAGLQFAMSTGDWFWQSDNAPTWATKEMDAQITALNNQADDAANAAAAADAARTQQEQAQYDEAQAAQDAQLSLAQNQSDAQDAVTQGQIDQQMQIADAQAAAQQAALDLQAQSTQQQAVQADLQWGIAHPEEFAQAQADEAAQEAQAQQDGGDGSDDGSDDGSSDGSYDGYGNTGFGQYGDDRLSPREASDVESQVDRTSYGSEADFNLPTQADNEAMANQFDEEG